MPAMKHWLMKSEPDEFSIDALERVVTEPWTGVRNYQARNFMLKEMKVGDPILFYHSNCAVPGVVGEEVAPRWRHYLRGLWASGLRLGESLDLWWDRPEKIFPVFPRDGRPMLQVPGELEKGNADRLLPIAPEFALFLLETPEAARTGPPPYFWAAHPPGICCETCVYGSVDSGVSVREGAARGRASKAGKMRAKK